MKLIIQIPCHNEAATLPATVRDLPRQVPGCSAVELLVIDDGSDDGTAEVARALGVEHVVRFPLRRGLAVAHQAGLDAALRLGAGVIVNTDGDNQYCGADVPALVAPIVAGRADLVVGDRQVARVPWFSPAKRALQRLGSAVVRLASGTAVPDATSGFRAYSREAALRLCVTLEFSPHLQTLIQAGHGGLAVAAVPVRTNPPTRPSRLFRSVPGYVASQALIIVRSFLVHQPLRAFSYLAAVFLCAAAVLGLRFLYYQFTRPVAGHVQSVVLCAMCGIAGLSLLICGLLADLSSSNRKLLQEVLFQLRRAELSRRPGEGPGAR